MGMSDSILCTGPKRNPSQSPPLRHATLTSTHFLWLINISVVVIWAWTRTGILCTTSQPLPPSVPPGMPSVPFTRTEVHCVLSNAPSCRDQVLEAVSVQQELQSQICNMQAQLHDAAAQAPTPAASAPLDHSGTTGGKGQDLQAQAAYEALEAEVVRMRVERDEIGAEAAWLRAEREQWWEEGRCRLQDLAERDKRVRELEEEKHALQERMDEQTVELDTLRHTLALLEEKVALVPVPRPPPTGQRGGAVG